jgi:hypothetical protein
VFGRFWSATHVGRQEQTLGIGELCTPPKFVLDHCSPQVDLAVDTALLVAELAQVLKALRRVDAARAGRVREFASVMHCFGRTDDGSASRGPATRHQRPTPEATARR